jgi:tripartite-type tricarboxylate transporter receptor subunit TctC
MRRAWIPALLVCVVAVVVTAQGGQVEFPGKGQPVSLIIPWAAGGGTDIGGRIIAAGLEKELGNPVQVINKPGASGQLGMTELAQARPDGHTIAYSALSSVVMNYTDPGRKATFQRKDLSAVAAHVADVRAVAVSVKSPYRSAKDLADAITATPGKVKAATVGALSDAHFAELWFEKLTGGQFTYVHYKGTGEAIPALIGGHVDVYFGATSELHPLVKGGEFRVLAILGTKESPFLPGVRTMEAQGYPIFYTTYRNFYAPGGTPKEIIDTLSKALMRVMESAEHRKKMEGELGIAVQYQDPVEMAKAWDDMEKAMKDLIPLARK